MKTKHFILSFLVMLSALSYAQTSAEASGIAIQGIARDDQNTARINQSITLTFELYYIDSSNAEVAIGSPVDANLTTDNFGVFSYILEPGVANNSIMANHQVYLRISEGSTTISNEKLKHVPYAIAANNGVPTGSIMPYVGTTAPEGWVLCDGQSLTGVVGSEKLIDLLGSNNAPNLQAMYLRGAGSQSYGGTNYAGIDLNEKQTHTIQMHNHDAGSLVTSNSGAHHHESTETYTRISSNGTSYNTFVGRNFGDDTSTKRTPTSGFNGEHSHAITGQTADGGTAGETRPVSYGVNYIIKL